MSKILTINSGDIDRIKREESILSRILEAQADLLRKHWPKISGIRNGADDSTVTITFSSLVDASGPKPHILTRISYAQRFKDEREDWVDDPNQPRLPLEEKP